MNLLNRIKYATEHHPDYEPCKFHTLTFYPSSPARNNIEWAVKSFQQFCICIARKLNSHIIPVAGIGKTKKGNWHIHYVLLVEKGRRKPTSRILKELWWKGNKRGRSGTILNYNPAKGGVIYSLQHEYYIPVSRPFCPGRKKCHKECIKNHNYRDIVLTSLGLIEESTVCWRSVKKIEHVPLYIRINKGGTMNE